MGGEFQARGSALISLVSTARLRLLSLAPVQLVRRCDRYDQLSKLRVSNGFIFGGVTTLPPWTCLRSTPEEYDTRETREVQDQHSQSAKRRESRLVASWPICRKTVTAIPVAFCLLCLLFILYKWYDQSTASA